MCDCADIYMGDVCTCVGVGMDISVNTHTYRDIYMFTFIWVWVKRYLGLVIYKSFMKLWSHISKPSEIV